MFGHNIKTYVKKIKHSWLIRGYVILSPSIASESMICFRRIWFLRKFYYLIDNLSMKHDVCMCNISIEREICRLHSGIKTTRLPYLINHNLSDPWLRTPEYDYFQTCEKFSECKTFDNYLCYISFNI